MMSAFEKRRPQRALGLMWLTRRPGMFAVIYAAVRRFVFDLPKIDISFFPTRTSIISTCARSIDLIARPR
jgi:hypothetical protein